jgi:hypothetical protein
MKAPEAGKREGFGEDVSGEEIGNDSEFDGSGW